MFLHGFTNKKKGGRFHGDALIGARAAYVKEQNLKKLKNNLYSSKKELEDWMIKEYKDHIRKDRGLIKRFLNWKRGIKVPKINGGIERNDVLDYILKNPEKFNFEDEIDVVRKFSKWLGTLPEENREKYINGINDAKRVRTVINELNVGNTLNDAETGIKQILTRREKNSPEYLQRIIELQESIIKKSSKQKEEAIQAKKDIEEKRSTMRADDSEKIELKRKLKELHNKEKKIDTQKANKVAAAISERNESLRRITEEVINGKRRIEIADEQSYKAIQDTLNNLLDEVELGQKQQLQLIEPQQTQPIEPRQSQPSEQEEPQR